MDRGRSVEAETSEEGRSEGGAAEGQYIVSTSPGPRQRRDAKIRARRAARIACVAALGSHGPANFRAADSGASVVAESAYR